MTGMPPIFNGLGGPLFEDTPARRGGRVGSTVRSGSVRFMRPAAGVLAAVLLVPGASSAADPAANPRPANRVQSLVTLTGGGPFPVPCLTPLILSVRQDPSAATAAARRALSLLQADTALQGERRWVAADGTSVRYTTDRASFDRIEPAGDDSGDPPDAVEAAIRGIAEARQLLVDQLGLASPGAVEVVLGRLVPSLDGYLVPSARRDARPVLVLDASARGPASTIRGAAIHQFAHAAAMATGAGIPPGFAEALAVWAEMRLDGGPDPRTASFLSSRLARLREGLLADDLELAAGNALFFAFLDENYGRTAVALAAQELSSGAPVAEALDRAIRRGSGETLASAFREFQLWSFFTGARSDGHHFSFADRLASPQFASEADGLPALSVQSDPPVGPLGATAVLLHPDEVRGGLSVRFEGDWSSRWEADLLLLGPAGGARRVGIPVAADGTGETTVPLDQVADAVLLVRDLDVEDRPAKRYTWSAFVDRGFPVEIASLDARPADGGNGMLVTWETSSERSLVGFNVLRRLDGSTTEIRINAIRIPALGEAGSPASYEILDPDAKPGTRYVYRVEAVTTGGMSSWSDAISVDDGPAAP